MNTKTKNKKKPPRGASKMDGKLQQRSDKDIEYQAVRREPPSDKAK